MIIELTTVLAIGIPLYLLWTWWKEGSDDLKRDKRIRKENGFED